MYWPKKIHDLGWSNLLKVLPCLSLPPPTFLFFYLCRLNWCMWYTFSYFCHCLLSGKFVWLYIHPYNYDCYTPKSFLIPNFFFIRRDKHWSWKTTEGRASHCWIGQCTEESKGHRLSHETGGERWVLIMIYHKKNLAVFTRAIVQIVIWISHAQSHYLVSMHACVCACMCVCKYLCTFMFIFLFQAYDVYVMQCIYLMVFGMCWVYIYLFIFHVHIAYFVRRQETLLLLLFTVLQNLQ